MALPPNASNTEYAKEVGRRIQAALNDKGWRQTDLWRALKSDLGEESAPAGRDNVSKWVRGLTLPREAKVREAVCRVLGKEDLFPAQNTDPPPFTLKQLANGQVWVTLDMEFSMSDALELTSLIKQQQQGKK
jgi:hypothetical protein